jgi:2'-5' RNA ligase
MRDCTRTFIAIAIPEPINEELARLQDKLAPEVPGCRWTSTRPFHITLAFLGDVPDQRLSRLCEIVAASSASIEPFEIEVCGLGAFPSPNRPRVVWAGVSTATPDSLRELQQSIAASVRRIGCRLDDLRFHPHITLGRMKNERQPAKALTPLIERYRLWSAGSCDVAEVVVFASTLSPAGPRYDVLGRGPLADKKTEARP